MEQQRMARRVLQRFFLDVVRKHGVRSSARQFCRVCTGLLEEAKAMPFEELSAKLWSDDMLLDASGSLLHRFLQLINWNGKRRANYPVFVTGVVNVKIFLAAYMIFARPDRAFGDSKDEDLEKSLYAASEPLLTCFHRLASKLCDMSWAQLDADADRKQLRRAMCTYLRTFQQWKIVDEARIAGRIRHAIRGLESAMEVEENKDDEKVFSELSNRHKRLRDKLDQIDGTTSGSKRHKKDGDDGAPASAASAAATSASVEKKSAAAAAGELPSISSSVEVQNDDAHCIMTREQLAHELLVDPLFVLANGDDEDDNDEHHGAAKRDNRFTDERHAKAVLRKVFERAFWNSLMDDLCAQPRPLYSRVIKVLEEMRDGVCHVTTIVNNRGEWSATTAQQIRDVIDIELIRQRLGAGALDYQDCIRLVDGVVDVRFFVCFFEFSWEFFWEKTAAHCPFPCCLTISLCTTFFKFFWEFIGRKLLLAIPFLVVSLSLFLSLYYLLQVFLGDDLWRKLAFTCCLTISLQILASLHERMRATRSKDRTLHKWQELKTRMTEASSSSSSSLQLQQHKYFCEALELCLDRLYAARVDASNNNLRALVPVMRTHGIEYMQEKFQDKLGQGLITLESTKRWMRRVVTDLLPPAAAAESSAPLACEEFERILWIAMVDLVVSEEGFREKKDFPEVFALDFVRIKALHAQFHGQVSAAAILITLDQEIRARVRDGIARSQLLKSISNAVLHQQHHDAVGPRNECKKVFLPGVCGISASGIVQQALDVLRKFSGIPENEVKVVGNLIQKHLQGNHPVYLHLVTCLFLLICATVLA